MTLEHLQPEHDRYSRGYRLWLAGKASWPEVQDMSLDDVDLQCLLLDAVECGRPAESTGEEIELP